MRNPDPVMTTDRVGRIMARAGYRRTQSNGRTWYELVGDQAQA